MRAQVRDIRHLKQLSVNFNRRLQIFKISQCSLGLVYFMFSKLKSTKVQPNYL